MTSNSKALFAGAASAAVLALAVVACSDSGYNAPAPMPAPPPVPGTPSSINVAAPPAPPAGSVAARLTTFATGLATPWGMAFLPDGRLLVTQKGGTLVVVSADGATVSAPISGVPAVDPSGQGGLLDVALDPQFATNRRIYLSYSEPGAAGTNGTAVARAELNSAVTALSNMAVIFQQQPKKAGTSGHYGSRLVFRSDGSLFVTLGERGSFAGEAQSLTSQLGKVARIGVDSSIPADNPFFAQGGNAAAVWSYGHRNPQAAALHPSTGELWVAEHGPQGGDEVNLSRAGRNFGWPTVSFGCNYGDPVGTACRIGGGTHNPPYTPPLVYWYATSTAPGGMAFYTGNVFPEWNGNLFVGGLNGRALFRFVLNGEQITGVETMFSGQHEIRDIKQGPDGRLYLLSRNTNAILRVDR
jgi:glucose/arabinose dehydrogenase